MKQYTVSRQVGVIPFAAGQPATLDLPRQYDLASIGLRISGTWTNADVGTALKVESPAGLIQRVEVIADGKNTIHSLPFWKAVWGNTERRSSIAHAIAELRTGPSATAAAAYAVLASGYIDCQTVDGLRPKDSNFRTAGLSLFQLKLTFGSPSTDVQTGVDSATFVGNVEVWVDECVELPDAAGKFTVPKFLKKTSFQEYNVSGSNSNYEIRLPAGNLIRSVFLRAADPTTGEPGAAFINKLTLQSGVDSRFIETAAAIRAKMCQKYGPIQQAGYYLADLASIDDAEIRLANLWDVSRQAEPKAFVDVAAACNLQVVTTEYIPLAAA